MQLLTFVLVIAKRAITFWRLAIQKLRVPNPVMVRLRPSRISSWQVEAEHASHGNDHGRTDLGRRTADDGGADIVVQMKWNS